MDDKMNLGGMTPGSGMIDRIKAILTDPKGTWPVIDAEPATAGELITRYALPLIAIGPVAAFIGGQLFGYGFLGVSYKPSLVGGLTTAVLSLVMSVIAVVVVALVAEWLAPKFGGTANRIAAFKLIVYGGTAGWLAGIFGLVPSLAVLGLAGLYSLYLFYTGATPLMKVPEDKAVGFTAVTVLVAAVALFVCSVLVTTVTGAAAIGAGALGGVSSQGELSGKLTVPGVGSVDAAKLEAAGKQLEAAANGSQVVVAPGAMQALLPTAIGSYQRTALESASAGNIGGSAEGTYTAGDKTFRLKLIDMSGLGALAGLGAAMGVQQSREDADGYERTGSVNGQMQTEEWNRKDGRGKYAITIASRFMIEAEGQAASIDDLKAAVAAVDQSALVGLVK